MGETKQAQKQTKAELDQKLELSAPSRKVLEDLAVLCAKDPSPDNTFQYAFALSRSSERAELRYAVTILDGLVKEGYQHQIDCMIGAATALYLLGDYELSRARAEAILRTQPENRSAAELHLASIASQEKLEQEQVKKIALGTGAAVAVGVVAGVASLLLKR